MNDVINTTRLTKYYGKTIAVSNVNLSIKKGEIFAFLGLNGAGKTTTIRMLLGMVTPTFGECYLQGRKIAKGNLNIWSKVGYMVETPYSYPELSVRENLEIIARLRSIQDKNSVDWIMKKLKLESYADRKAKHLSLGNSQRLGIAKAIMHRPEILILDEPTNGLDPEGIIEVRELLRDLAGNMGVTILISSHKLDEISRIATNIGIIHYGKLIRELSGAQLEGQLKKVLIVDGKDRKGISQVLTKAGYKVGAINGFLAKDSTGIQINEEAAVNYPERIAAMLVNSGCAPTLLKVEKEDLETFFIRTIREAGGILQ